MFLLKLIIVLLGIFLIFFLVEKVLRKVFKVEKSKGIIYKPVNKSHKIGERVLLALFFISLFLQIFYSTPPMETTNLLIIFFIILNGYRAFMEWKYQKESKEFIITTGNLVMFILFFYFLFKLNILDLMFD
jgi:hypothetical protein